MKTRGWNQSYPVPWTSPLSVQLSEQDKCCYKTKLNYFTQMPQRVNGKELDVRYRKIQCRKTSSLMFQRFSSWGFVVSSASPASAVSACTYFRRCCLSFPGEGSWLCCPHSGAVPWSPSCRSGSPGLAEHEPFGVTPDPLLGMLRALPPSSCRVQVYVEMETIPWDAV